jgi:hypothetical protein
MWVIRFLVFIFLLGVIGGVYVKNNPPIAPETQFSLWLVDHKTTLYKKKVDKSIQDVISYAFDIWWDDFVYTIEAESWFNPYAVGRDDDNGLCQLLRKYHKPFIESNRFNDPFEQVNYCYLVWKDAIKKNRLTTTFYGYNVREKVKNRFIFWYK